MPRLRISAVTSDPGAGHVLALHLDLDEAVDERRACALVDVGRKGSVGRRSIPKARAAEEWPRRRAPGIRDPRQTQIHGRLGRVEGRQLRDLRRRVRQQDAQAGRSMPVVPLLVDQLVGVVLVRVLQGPPHEVDRLRPDLRVDNRQVELLGARADAVGALFAGSNVEGVGVLRQARPLAVVPRPDGPDGAAFVSRQVAVDVVHGVRHDRRGDSYGAGVTGARGQPVRQVRPDDVADGGDAIRNGQRLAGRFGQEQVAVGVDAPAERERLAGVERQVRLREDAELEDRDGDRLQRALHADLGAAGDRPRRDHDVVRRDQTLEALVGAVRDGGSQSATRRPGPRPGPRGTAGSSSRSPRSPCSPSCRRAP